ncbi:type II toxin-antitoxin system VapC family toxin [Methylocystis sp. JR02]|uniref:type II toxin-antitoxin system VapC family toxin n=1 Tax=Methylocystis sp. JR02 TaxID=3046284 RepID=UPI0024BA75B2|nr:type II toxin-antitoxin system VapC family toxin [Methylocystis sp. JR02]MDJ0447790.1 type II toxin-antitoxin system VapC family toxin [Methylocystis sp. JR02]
MIFVVDASVVVKWFVEEPRHDLARDLFKSGAALVAPDIVLIETSNAFQKKASSGQMDRAQVKEAVSTLNDCFSELVPFSTLLPAALEMSLALKHPIYDCTYLACAEMVNGRLVTDDEKFFKRCAGNGRADAVVLLKDHSNALSEAIQDSVLPFTQELLSLFQIAQDTWNGICGRLGVSPAGGNLTDHALPWEIYTNSVPRRRLVSVLQGLPRENLAALLAIAWYGRGTNPDLAQGYRHALAIVGADTSTEIPYVAMQLQHIEIGLLMLQGNRDGPAASGDHQTD